MSFSRTAIPDVILFEPHVFNDDRGFFFESFNETVFAEAAGKSFKFVQENHSQSKRGVLRGLHYQVSSHAQGKLVRVVSGRVFDVAVDIRKGSPTYGRWVGTILSENNKAQLWIPPGFAHGFLVLSTRADLLYKATNFYNPSAERCIKWDDPDIGIIWPIDCHPTLSDRDARAGTFANVISAQ
jgi:dTDP-4-dehydrorhamnose 3,5-epimerase